VKRQLWLTLLFAALLGITVAQEAVSAEFASTGIDACCEGEVACCTPQDSDTHREAGDEECCQDDCTDCGLRCCFGPVFVLPATIGVDVGEHTRGSLLPDDRDYFSTDRSGIDHPPRS
jgi:hypothetical protein